MISKQEMFDRAWLGLKAQGFVCAADRTEHVFKIRCTYLDSDGNRCAWGHVDPVGTVRADGSPVGGAIKDLWVKKIGLAGDLNEGHMQFARDLQICHDGSSDPENMEIRLRSFAISWELVIPE